MKGSEQSAHFTMVYSAWISALYMPTRAAVVTEAVMNIAGEKQMAE